MLKLDRHGALRFVQEHRDLFDAQARANPFASSEWTQHFLEHIARDDWCFLVPFVPGRQGSAMLLYGAGDPRKLSAVTNYYASQFSPVLAEGEAPGQAATLVEQIVAARPRVQSVTLAPMDADAPETASVSEAFKARGWFVRRYFCFGNWYLPCRDLAFKDYMAARDSRLRNTWTRKARKFEGAAAEARVEVITLPGDVDRGMDAYETVYAQSWKQAEPYPGFIRGWARICAARGWLRLGIAWKGDQPIAAQFWFTANGVACIFKLAYDERFASLSAGTVLTAVLMKQALDVDKVHVVDYLTGDDDYKRSWMSHRRERVGIFACNPATLTGLCLTAREQVGMATRKLRTSLFPGRRPSAAAAG